MTANLCDIIWAGTSHDHAPWIVVVFNPDLIPGIVHIIFYPVADGLHQRVMIDHFNVARMMNFLATANYFVTGIIINMLDEMG